MNSLSVNSVNIAEAGTPQWSVNPLVGSYELCFDFSLQIGPLSQEENCAAVIYGARISAKGVNGGGRLGVATLEKPVVVRPSSGRKNEYLSFRLPMQSPQLTRLEEIRDGGDLEFTLSLCGESAGGTAIFNEWTAKAPRSEWIERLRQSRFSDILLLEVPMPPKGARGKLAKAGAYLQEAQKHFVNGDYTECVSRCRLAIDQMVSAVGGKTSKDALGPLSNNRKAMTKDERESALWATLQHYTHLAHHADDDGGATYNRSEARLVMTLTATLIQRAP